jgi:hypothetical protein
MSRSTNEAANIRQIRYGLRPSLLWRIFANADNSLALKADKSIYSQHHNSLYEYLIVITLLT